MAAFTGNDLRKWREAQQISAADLAERISCDATTIYRYESGKIKPNPDVMYEICVELGDPDKCRRPVPQSARPDRGLLR